MILSASEGEGSLLVQATKSEGHSVPHTFMSASRYGHAEPPPAAEAEAVSSALWKLLVLRAPPALVRIIGAQVCLQPSDCCFPPLWFFRFDPCTEACIPLLCEIVIGGLQYPLTNNSLTTWSSQAESLVCMIAKWRLHCNNEKLLLWQRHMFMASKPLDAILRAPPYNVEQSSHTDHPISFNKIVLSDCRMNSILVSGEKLACILLTCSYLTTGLPERHAGPVRYDAECNVHAAHRLWSPQNPAHKYFSRVAA